MYDSERKDYSDYTVENLKSWQPGTSGNPRGRPKGSRNVKKVVRELLNDPNIYKKLHVATPVGAYTPLEAIIYTLIAKSISGDTRAAEVLLKYAVDQHESTEAGGFFSSEKLVVRVVNTNGTPYDREDFGFDDATGRLLERSAD